MAVEILFLSGARQGERLVIDRKEFMAGFQSGCEVSFDPVSDVSALGRSASFRLLPDGWHIHASGGRVLVNQQAVAGWTHLRSGDIVRMSAAGPDFSFGIVGDLPSTASPAPPPAEKLPPIVPPPMEMKLVVVPPPPPADYLASQAAGSWRTIARRWAVMAALGVAAGVVLPFAVCSLQPVREAVVESQGASMPAPEPLAAMPSEPEPLPAPPVEATAKTAAPPVAAVKKQTFLPPKEVAPPDAFAAVAGSVFLLQVEKADQSWPFASCVAVGDDTLLTSAREAVQLARFRQDEGFKVWATQPGDDFKEEVDSILVNRLFSALADKPNDWVYANLGLLTVRGRLPRAASLASIEELSNLEPGTPVSCVGFTHNAEKITRFDYFDPVLSHGKVYVITAKPDVPGMSRLLHLRMEMPKNTYGCPLVNPAGHIVGVYSETASASDESGKEIAVKNMHYGTVVNPEMVQMWVRDRNAEVWVPAIEVKPLPQDER